MKRFFIISVLLFFSTISLLGGWLYCVDLNDYSPWIRKQFEQATGYQVTYTSIEKRGPAQFVVTDLSVARDKSQLLHIDKIDIALSRFDLWHRQLTLELVELSGVDLHLQENSLQRVLTKEKKSNVNEQKTAFSPWFQLRINALRISAINADIRTPQLLVSLRQGSVDAQHLTVIEHNRWTLALGALQLNCQSLDLQNADVGAWHLQHLTLHSHFDLSRWQAKLAIAVKHFTLSLPKQQAVIADNSVLQMQLDKSSLRLTRLITTVFSGELQLQAEALLAFRFLPTPVFSVDKLTIESLLAKEMRITVPFFLATTKEEPLTPSAVKAKWPIKTLLLKQIVLQNIDISSADKQLPLTVKGLNSRLTGLTLLQNHQLMDLSAMPSAEFSLQFTALLWKGSLLQRFSMAGNLAENLPLLLHSIDK